MKILNGQIVHKHDIGSFITFSLCVRVLCVCGHCIHMDYFTIEKDVHIDIGWVGEMNRYCTILLMLNVFTYILIDLAGYKTAHNILHKFATKNPEDFDYYEHIK